MNSRTYQLTAEPNESNRNDHTSYSRALVRRLPAEVILDMQSDVLDAPADFAGYRRGIRAVQIPGVQSSRSRGGAPELGDRFLRTFGKPQRILACDCERSNETTLKQVFVLIGDGLNERLADPSNRLYDMARSPMSDQEIVDELYWTALSRPPSETERAAAIEAIRLASDQTISLQDMGRAFFKELTQPTSEPSKAATAETILSSTNRAAALEDIAWALMNAKEFLFRK